jgi:hypothetical protein
MKEGYPHSGRGDIRISLSLRHAVVYALFQSNRSWCFQKCRGKKRGSALEHPGRVARGSVWRGDLVLACSDVDFHVFGFGAKQAGSQPDTGREDLDWNKYNLAFPCHFSSLTSALLLFTPILTSHIRTASQLTNHRTMAAIMNGLKGLTGSLSSLGTNAMNTIFPPEKRAALLAKIQAFAANNPKLSVRPPHLLNPYIQHETNRHA